MRYAEVAVDAPAGFDRTFSYSIPSDVALTLGQVVQVPFGNRSLQGVVFSLESFPQVSQTRDILGAIEPQSLLSSQQLELARWISQYYMASLFDAAALMLPPGFRSRLRDYVILNAAHEGAAHTGLTQDEERVLQHLRGKGRVERGALIKALGKGSDKTVSRLFNSGLVSQESRWDRPRVGPKYEAYLQLAKGAHQIMEELSARAPKQAALLEHLASQDSQLSLSQLRKRFGVAAVKGLQTKGLVEQQRVRVERDPLAGKAFQSEFPLLLTPDQESATSEIGSALESPGKGAGVFLLRGVTGSGKTEVYLQAVERCMSLGKGAIVLVPEIALTPQTILRFAGRFPGKVAVLHSRLSPGEHFDQWWRIREGEYGVVIGSRSALFSSQPNLGLIVIDEEHEWTYKQQEPAPRYHARDVALKLAQLTGAVVVLGSATPDVVTYYHALRGSLRLLELPQRIAPAQGVETVGAPEVRRDRLPAVQIVDMRKELREGNRSIFSRALREGMASTLGADGQVILFLNRRGSASYMQCSQCGLTQLCRRCDVALTYHAREGGLICHYCNYRRPVPDKCPRCLSRRMRYMGLGTQAVVEEVIGSFPGTKVLRWDRDATRNPIAHEELLDRFLKGEAQVLVGTQMIAKGLHIPSVTLVGVISADTGLNAPDFRAGERAFQVLCQIAGRAGRGPSEGQVIIQTYQPEHYAVAAAAKQDYKAFYQEEMEFRRRHGNPPFSRLIRLLYSHTNQALCQRRAQTLAKSLRQEQDTWGLSDIEVLGPAPTFPLRIRGHYRWHLVLRGASPAFLLKKVPFPQGWVVDVNPVSLA